jgi:hypothetical protein
MLKNPYKDDLENVLKPAEKEYLKSMLFEINKYMLDLSPKQ